MQSSFFIRRLLLRSFVRKTENMEENRGEKCVCGKRTGKVDRLSNLPDSLLFQILLDVPTKDVVKTSVLSSRWRNLWSCVPVLDLCYGDIPEYDTFVSFVDSFLGFNIQPCLQKFELKYHNLKQKFKGEWYDIDIDHFTKWIDTVIKQKVQYLHLMENPWPFDEEDMGIPLTLYTCESLVSLKLCEVILPNPKSVSLPSLKVMYLDAVMFANGWVFEMLISGCPILESLTVKKCDNDKVQAFRVCSKSLLSFTLVGHNDENLDEDLVVVIDAPRLEKLELDDHQTDSIIIKNTGSLVKVVIDVMFNMSQFYPNVLSKRNVMFRNFLLGISSVKDMVITSDTLVAIYNFSKCETLPLFRNLSSLRADFNDYRWEMLPVFLESCPNLRSLTLGFRQFPEEEEVSILPRTHSFLPSLEFVEIVKPMIDAEEHIKLVSYFLKNSTILKKFTFSMDDFRKYEVLSILKKVAAVPRISESCEVMID